MHSILCIVFLWSCLQDEICLGKTDNPSSDNPNKRTEDVNSYVMFGIGKSLGLIVITTIVLAFLNIGRRFIAEPVDLTIKKKEICLDSPVPLSNPKEPVDSKVPKKKEMEINSDASVPLSTSNFKDDQCGLENEIRIVLLGKTGSGKSATGNTILGKENTNGFKTALSGSSVTKGCLHKHSVRFGHKIVVVDTPGIFDTEEHNENTQKEIFKCIGITSPGPHVFILVTSLSRFTKEENQSVQHFVDYFGDAIFKYLIVLFTRKDDLDREGKSILEHIKTFPCNFQRFIDKCGGRVIAFNNTLDREETNTQVEELLLMILDNIKSNNGECYTDEMYSAVEAQILEREEEKRQKLDKEKQLDIQEIEKRIGEDYDSKIKEKMIENEQTEKELEEFKKLYQEKENENSFLKNKINSSQEQQEKSKGIEMGDIKHTLEKMETNIDLNDKNNAKTKQKIISVRNKLEEKIKKRKKEIEELSKLQDEKIKELKQKLRQEYESREKSIRDDVRNEIEQGKNIFTKLLEFLGPKFVKFLHDILH